MASYTGRRLLVQSPSAAFLRLYFKIVLHKKKCVLFWLHFKNTSSLKEWSPSLSKSCRRKTRHTQDGWDELSLKTFWWPTRAIDDLLGSDFEKPKLQHWILYLGLCVCNDLCSIQRIPKPSSSVGSFDTHLK